LEGHLPRGPAEALAEARSRLRGLKDLLAEAKAVQAGPRYGEDPSAYGSRVVAVALKLKVSPDKAKQTYLGNRPPANQGGPKSREELAREADAIRKTLSDSRISPEARRALIARANSMGDALVARTYLGAVSADAVLGSGGTLRPETGRYNDPSGVKPPHPGPDVPPPTNALGRTQASLMSMYADRAEENRRTKEQAADRASKNWKEGRYLQAVTDGAEMVFSGIGEKIDHIGVAMTGNPARTALDFSPLSPFGDAKDFIQDPSSRTPVRYALAAAGVIPGVKPLSKVFRAGKLVRTAEVAGGLSRPARTSLASEVKTLYRGMSRKEYEEWVKYGGVPKYQKVKWASSDPKVAERYGEVVVEIRTRGAAPYAPGAKEQEYIIHRDWVTDYKLHSTAKKTEPHILSHPTFTQQDLDIFRRKYGMSEDQIHQLLNMGGP